ncbi:hypothetical protein B0H13DRAFT_1560894, partial [Mycena leptocephala]
PERFLLDDRSPKPAVPDPEVAPRLIALGQPRVCPGCHMASASLWITFSSVLVTFDITKAVDEHEREIEPSYEFDSGFINAPNLPFKCSIRPRSKEA